MLHVVISFGLKGWMNCEEGAVGWGLGAGGQGGVRTRDGESLRKRFKALLH